MIRYSKLPDNISSLLPEAAAYLQSRKEVLFAYLFGSLAMGKISPLSDVDIAVYISDDMGFEEKKLEILGGLIESLQTDEIDLVLLNNASVTLKMKILENKKVLVDKAPFFRHRYESLAMRKYFDFSIKENAILERRFLHGR